jgi:hypothetical protein
VELNIGDIDIYFEMRAAGAVVAPSAHN